MISQQPITSADLEREEETARDRLRSLQRNRRDNYMLLERTRIKDTMQSY